MFQTHLARDMYGVLKFWVYTTNVCETKSLQHQQPRAYVDLIEPYLDKLTISSEWF